MAKVSFLSFFSILIDNLNSFMIQISLTRSTSTTTTLLYHLLEFIYNLKLFELRCPGLGDISTLKYSTGLT